MAILILPSGAYRRMATSMKNAHALLVGIANYQNIRKLPTVGDAKDIGTDDALRAGLSESCYEALREGRGRVILAASRSTETSIVLAGAKYGLFTQHLLAGLRGAVASEDGLIRIFDLFEYLQP